MLFGGTLRENLDPYGKHTDEELWRAIDGAKLTDAVKQVPGKLDATILQGGENWSVGQRQLICLARALLRRTNVLVLDEATASIDLETESLLQTTIRQEFAKCTVLTIAHRLNTILGYDKILVLDKGQVVEFDSPNALLLRPDSHFHQLLTLSRNEIK